MKMLMFMVCLMGSAFTIPGDSLVPEASKKKASDQYKNNTTVAFQTIRNSSESQEHEMTSSESSRDQGDSPRDRMTEHNGHVYGAQSQYKNNSEYGKRKLDYIRFLSQEFLKALDPAERPTESLITSQPNNESNDSLSDEDPSKDSNEDHSISIEDYSKDSTVNQTMRPYLDYQGIQRDDTTDSQEQDTDYRRRLHLIEIHNDEGATSEDVNSDEIPKGRRIIRKVSSQDSEQEEDSIYSDKAMEESSQIPELMTQQYAQSQQVNTEGYEYLVEATLQGVDVNASSTENEHEEDTGRQSQEGDYSDENNSELEEQAKSQSLYEAAFLDATNIGNKDDSHDSREHREATTFSDLTGENKRSKEEMVFQANKTLETKGDERFGVDDSAQEKEGDSGVDTNETGEDRILSTREPDYIGIDIQESGNTISLEQINESLSESTEHVKSVASFNNEETSLSDQEMKEIIDDPCRNFRCKRGKICELDEEEKPRCICQDVISCPETVIFEQVCGTDNKTYDSECHLFGRKCQLEGTRKGNHLHLDYRGSCKNIPLCSEYELAQFPLRMRDWLKNVLVQLYESDLDESGFLTEKQRNKVKKIYQHEKRLINGDHTLDLLLRDFEKNYHMYVYPVHWQFSQLDQHPIDRRLSHSELSPLRAPLVPMEHCITKFFKGCNTDKDKYVSLKEWCCCFGIKEEDIHESLLF